MSIEHSMKFIKDIADRKEADEYFEGLLKDHEMLADAERAEHQSKWDLLTKDAEVIQIEPPQSDREIEP